MDSSSNNHGCLVKQLSKSARKRLKELNLDDYEKLYSLRLDAKSRVWGIFEDGYFRVLWWDPKHQVYPSKLTNT